MAPAYNSSTLKSEAGGLPQVCDFTVISKPGGVIGKTAGGGGRMDKDRNKKSEQINIPERKLRKVQESLQADSYVFKQRTLVSFLLGTQMTVNRFKQEERARNCCVFLSRKRL